MLVNLVADSDAETVSNYTCWPINPFIVLLDSALTCDFLPGVFHAGLRLFRMFHQTLREEDMQKLIGAVFFTLLTATLACAGSTSIVSISSKGEIGNDSSYGFDVSADGQFVVFRSKSDNLVNSDKNGEADIFLHDRATGETERINLNAQGLAADDESEKPAISADGRFVAYVSKAENLTEVDNNARWQVYVHDRETATVEIVSVNNQGEAGNYDSLRKPVITPDGRYVAFESKATNLVPGAFGDNIYLFDRSNKTIQLVGKGGTPLLSADGRFVVYRSFRYENNISYYDILRYNADDGGTELVNTNIDGTANTASCTLDDISDDGNLIAFTSSASNLVPNDVNGTGDCFVVNMSAGTTELVSRSTDGLQGDGYSSRARLNADNSRIAFMSSATNFDAASISGVTEGYVRDLTTGNTELFTLISGDNEYAAGGKFNRNLDVFVFQSGFDNYIAEDDNGWFDVFVRTR
jgi:Tol biopolymer transport system component